MAPNGFQIEYCLGREIHPYRVWRHGEIYWFCRSLQECNQKISEWTAELGQL